MGPKAILEIYRVLCNDRDFIHQEDVMLLNFHVLNGIDLTYIKQKSTETKRRNRQLYHSGRLLTFSDKEKR